MNNSQQPLNDSARHRQLEALFADEPFLSPTMKARRLHEKLQEARAKESRPAERTTEKAREPDMPFWVDDKEPPAFLRAERAPAGERRMNFAEATERLRRSQVPGSLANSPLDRLSHFRAQVLPQWLKQAPRREIDPRAAKE